MSPRERSGQDSMARAAPPAGHSAPMPNPSSVRMTSRKVNVGEKPAMNWHSEYQATPAQPVSHPAGGAGAEQAHPQRQGDDQRGRGQGDVSSLPPASAFLPPRWGHGPLRSPSDSCVVSLLPIRSTSAR